MERKEINKQDTWDLTKLFKNEKSYDITYKEVEDLTQKIVELKGHIFDDVNHFYKYLTLNEELDKKLERLYVYSYLYYYQDTTDSKGKSLKEKIEFLSTKVNEALSFCKTELLSKNEDDIKELINKNKKLSKYRFYLEQLYRYKKCTLSKEEENIITMACNSFGNCDDAFGSLDDADVKFSNVLKDGKECELNHSTYIKFMNDKDRKVREDAFKKYYQFYIDHKNTLASLYKGQIKEDNFIAKVRHFSSALSYSLYQDAILDDVYFNLINMVHKNLDALWDYLTFKKESLGLDKLHMYDLYVDVSDASTKNYSFEEAKETILDALKPLGEQYVLDMKQAFSNRWIDKYPSNGKRSGAYQWGCYGVSPYVSLNFTGDYNSVSTLIHELGHAMHSYYSNKNQEYVDSGYPIFLAEIASTVNEVLLNEYMIQQAKTNEEKLFYVMKFLDEFKSTVYRQTQFAEFEMLTHNMDSKEEALTAESLYKVYYDLNKLYYGNDVVSDEEIGYEWSRIPHFYTAFYVYKYATGFSCAIKIASDILNHKKDALSNYLKFLSSGGSDYPLHILKNCGIDITSGEVILDAVAMFRNRLDLAKKLREEMKDNGKK